MGSGIRSAIRLLAFALVFLASCGPATVTTPDGPTWVVTIPPLAEMVQTIAGEDARVAVLVPAGASPHTYAPRPSEVAQAESAAAVFFVAPNLDGWIVRYAEQTRVSLFEFVPEAMRLPLHEGHGDHGEWDSHFWMDPTLMAVVAPKVAEVMAERDPSRAAQYRERGAAYAATLDRLHEELKAMMDPIRGRAVILVHPSLSYFLKRYGLEVAGYVEPVQGSKPSPRDLAALIDMAKAWDVRAVFSETQLPRQAVAAVAESLDLPVFELDPLGGVEGRLDYASLLRYNARVLLEALR